MLRKLVVFMGATVIGFALGACGGGEGVPTPGVQAGPAKASQPARQRLSMASVSSSNRLGTFWAWAASAYPQHFSGGTQDGTIFVDGYGTFSYRHFDSGNYLAVLDDSIHVYGLVTGNTILRVGTLDDFVCSVYPGNQGCAQLSVAGVLNGNLASALAVDQGEHTIYLFAGLSYAFTATSAMFDTYLGLYAPDGAFVRANDNTGSGTDSAVLYTPSSSGLYTLHVSSQSGSGAYALKAFFQSSVTSDGSFIVWPGLSGNAVTDATRGDNFSFDVASRCLYSWNRNELMTDLCLDPGSSSGTFAGQAVRVILVTTGTGCSAALADPFGFAIDIDTTGMTPKVVGTDTIWETVGCT
jgi:hypothetical protein